MINWKFIFRLLLLIIPLVAFILFVNIRVDGGFVIHNRSNEIAKILVSGKNAGVKFIPSNWGGLQIAVVDEQLNLNDPHAKDILVFGTSRSSELHSEMFPSNTFYNCAIPNGNIKDYIALYGLYKKHNLLPKYVIISIDPWTFHARKSVTVNKEIHYVSDLNTPLRVNSNLADDYAKGLKYLGFNDPENQEANDKLTIDNMIELFNPNYFQLNLKSLTDKIVIETKNDSVNSYFIIRSDGSYTLTQQSQVDSGAVTDKTNRFVNVQKSDFFVASDTNSIQWLYFKKLLISLKMNGVIPIVYISPVNPIVFDHLADQAKVLLEDKIDLFCKDNMILRIGSFNPHLFGYHSSSNLFMDPYHPVKTVVEQLFYFRKNELKAIGINTAQ